MLLAGYNFVALLFRLVFAYPGGFARSPMPPYQLERTGLEGELVVPSDYRIVNGPPSMDDYFMIRALSGLPLRDRKQAEVAIGGVWTAVHIVETKSEACVGMGRVIGDGGWCFHIIDMAVLPMHQHQGLGEAILRALLERIGRTLQVRS